MLLESNLRKSSYNYHLGKQDNSLKYQEESPGCSEAWFHLNNG